MRQFLLCRVSDRPFHDLYQAPPKNGYSKEITENTADSASDDWTEQQDFTFDRKNSDTPVEENVCLGTTTSEFLGSSDTAGGNASAGNGIGAAVAELIIQPHIAPISGGGSGSGNGRGWNDEDKEKRQNPDRRRR